MSIHHMTRDQLVAFSKALNAKTMDTFVDAKEVRVMATDKGVVVALVDAHGGAKVIGDSIGVWWGPDAPAYFGEGES